MEQKKYSTAFVQKDPMNTIETYHDSDKSPLSRSDSRRDKLPVNLVKMLVEPSS